MANKVSRAKILVSLGTITIIVVLVVVSLRNRPATTTPDRVGTGTTMQKHEGLVLKASFVDRTDAKSKTFKPGEPIILKVVIRNNSSLPWSVSKAFLRMPEMYVIKNSKGKVYQSINDVHLSNFRITEVTIEGGQEYAFETNLLEKYPHISDISLGLGSLKTPDDYTVQVVLESPLVKYKKAPDANFPARLWPEDLKSEVLKFTVRQLTDAEINAYVARIKTGSEKDIVEILGVLGAVQAKKAVPDILSIASNDLCEKIKISAIMALTRMPDKTVVRQVEKIVTEDPSTMVKCYACALLGYLKDKDSAQVLIKILSQRDKYPLGTDGSVWYAAAIRSLGDIGDEAAIPILTEIAENDPTEWVRKATKINIERIRKTASPAL